MATRSLAAAMAGVFLAACAGSGSGTAADAADVPWEVATDVSGDVPAETAEDAPGEAADPGPQGRARFVNPMIGTGGAVFNLGSAHPGATAPLGLVKVGPDTVGRFGGMPPSFQHCSGYRYEDEHLFGFSHNRLHGTGAGDYGNVVVRPTVGMDDAKTRRDGYRSPYTHEGEVATPGYYAVTLSEPAVRAEMTATTRCAHHRYEFLDKPAEGVVLIDVAAAMGGGRCRGGEVRIDAAARTVEGRTWNVGDFSGRYDGFPVFFSATFDRAPAGVGTWLDGKVQDARAEATTTADPASLGGYLRFAAAGDATVEVKVCLSYVSLDGARAAMAAEMPAWDFEGTRAATEAAWERELSVIAVEGGTGEDLVNFHTAVYHVLQMPTTWTDADGKYLGFDKQAHVADGWTYYTDLSLWDTFRTEHPLLALAWPAVQRDVMRSLAAQKEQGGYVPQWSMGAGDTGSMIGQHSASVAADSWVKGIRDFDVESLWAGLKQTADGPLPPGSYGQRDCISQYLELGYAPGDECGGSVSLTVEYAFNDFCMARLAEGLGRTDDAKRYDARAGNWRNHWHAESGFLFPRNRDGTFVPVPVEEWSPEPYVEGTAWQWLWFVPHDEAGLREVMGGDERFVARLAEFFEKSDAAFSFEMPNAWYFHGNEPDIHAASLFIRAGRPDLAQKWTLWALRKNYRNTFDGLSGNDDAGTLAAWYVFAAIGLYPVPCVPGYYVTSPIFERTTLHLAGGEVVIEAPGASAGKSYVRKAAWNGAPLDVLWLTHEQIAKGGTLALEMSATP
ncbi:MAG: GH92 family glycosyl hydrolase [Deltaproteobacteria bacterium]|nr:GH92 family glycosyl hydrolase [Deltaproteobacteria bacterium]